MSGIRFNSTSPANSIPPADASAAATPADAPVSPTTTEQPSDLSNLHDVDINSIPEKIGYLKELGLDYGWGPSAFMEYVIEHIHIWGGLPWWASVAGAGLLIRLVLFKPMLEATDAGAKLHNLKPETQPITEKMLTCSRNGDNAGAMRYRQELSALKKSHGIRTFAPFIPFLQIPFGFGCFRAVRGMAALPVPGLAEESAAWITDLTVPDPYFILPAVSSCLLYYSLKVCVPDLAQFLCIPS